MSPRSLFATPFWLFTGCVITIALSWVIAAWMPLRPTTCIIHHDASRSYRNPSIGILTYGGAGWTRRGWDSAGYPQDIVRQTHMLFHTPVRIDDRPLHWLRWGTAEAARSKPPHLIQLQCEHATGWPLRAMWYSATFPGQPSVPAFVTKLGTKNSVPTVTGGIALPLPPDPLGVGIPLSKCRALPLRPVFVGFLINTIVWAIIAKVSAIAFISLHTHRRLRRNHCPRCNYDLSASPTTCPECGWNRPAKS